MQASFASYKAILPIINFGIWNNKLLIIFGTKTKRLRLNDGLRTKRKYAAATNLKSG